MYIHNITKYIKIYLLQSHLKLCPYTVFTRKQQRSWENRSLKTYTRQKTANLPLSRLFHGIRKVKAKLGLYQSNTNGLDFYQYAFDRAEFSALLQDNGFEVVNGRSYDGFKGVKDEMPIITELTQWRWLGPRFEKWLKSCRWIEKYFGHMALFVCRRI